MGRSARQAALEHAITDSLGTRSRRVLITGAAGQLGHSLAEAFAADQVTGVDLAEWDVAEEAPSWLEAPDLVLHAAAWTDVDGAEADPDSAERANAQGTRNVAALGAPLVYYSSDYVFSGSKGAPYLESDPADPLSVYGRTKLEGEQAAGGKAWIVRSSWLFGATGNNFLRTMLELGAEREEVAVVDDQRGCPTYVGHLAAATRQIVELPFGVYHAAADGDCSWKEFAEAIFEEAELSCRVRAITSVELNRPAPRPAYSVLRSEK
ncbi:MAG: dTDP-4-dehydrorhamnose reductase, partial [Gaiellaceae bacterium]